MVHIAGLPVRAALQGDDENFIESRLFCPRYSIITALGIAVGFIDEALDALCLSSTSSMVMFSSVSQIMQFL